MYQEFEIRNNKTSHYHIGKLIDMFDVKMVSVYADGGCHCFLKNPLDVSLIGNEISIKVDEGFVTFFTKDVISRGYYKDNEICFDDTTLCHVCFEVNSRDMESIVNYLIKYDAIVLS